MFRTLMLTPYLAGIAFGFAFAHGALNWVLAIPMIVTFVLWLMLNNLDKKFDLKRKDDV